MDLDYIPQNMRKAGKTIGAVTIDKPKVGVKGSVQSKGVSSGGMRMKGKAMKAMKKMKPKKMYVSITRGVKK